MQLYNNRTTVTKIGWQKWWFNISFWKRAQFENVQGCGRQMLIVKADLKPCAWFQESLAFTSTMKLRLFLTSPWKIHNRSWLLSVVFVFEFYLKFVYQLISLVKLVELPRNHKQFSFKFFQRRRKKQHLFTQNIVFRKLINISKLK